VKYIRKVLAALRKADEEFSLIDKGDRILLGISGGKDSMCLLKTMSMYSLFAHKDFKIIPAIIDLGFDGFDPEPLRNYCKSLGFSLYVDDSKFVYQALKDHQKDGKHLPCSICSRMKKAAMNNLAKKLKCNKVAFAHHKDDAIETLFMNMIHGATVKTFEPKMVLSKTGITFIRPLIFTTEFNLTMMCEEENIPIFPSHCPADKHTDRENIKNLLKSIYQTYSESERNFEEMLTNYDKFQLYFNRIEYVNEFNPSYSLRPITNSEEVISYYTLKEKEKSLTLLKNDSINLFVLYKHKIVGRLSFTIDNSHTCEIKKFELIEKNKNDYSIVLKHFIKRMSGLYNPITFIYKSKNKKAALENGFSLKYGNLSLKIKI